MIIKRRDVVLGILLISVLLIVFLNSSLVSATSTQTVCAIYTKQGTTCQDVLPSDVNTNPAYPTTSYNTACSSVADCSGTCVDPTDGLCAASNKYDCTSSSGNYFSSLPNQVPQCAVGCCLLGDQSSLTTQDNCQNLSSQKGVNLNFDPNVNDQATCSAMAYPEIKGACVYQTSSTTTCQFTTKKNCDSLTAGTNIKFYPDFLCTNQNLGTNCVKTQETTCLDTSDQVFYVDSCGNTANVYDSTKYNTINYWNYIAGTNGVANVSGGDNNGNRESPTNGNCNYLNGSTCMEYNAATDTNKPIYGDNICRDLSCKTGSFVSVFTTAYGSARTQAGIPKYPVNGESWCGTEINGRIILGGTNGSTLSYTLGNYVNNNNAGSIVTGVFGSAGGASYLLPSTLNLDKSSALPGTVYTEFICQNGEITTKTYDARQKVCDQYETTNGYFSSSIAMNRWQDCYYQNSSKNCLDNSTRDCEWILGYSIENDPSTGLPYVYDSATDQLVPRQDTKGALGALQPDSRPGASCVPKYAPGFDISVDGLLTSSGIITGPSTKPACSLATTICNVTYTRSKAATVVNAPWELSPDNGNVVCLTQGEDLAQPWTSSISNLCSSLGDCGMSVNYVGTSGSNGPNDLFKVFRGSPSS